MARTDDTPRLFQLSDLLSREELAADEAVAVEPQTADQRSDLDSAKMYLSRYDGLLIRGVKPHSAEKSWMVSRSLDTVSTAMAGKWPQIGYLELYSGPGRLLDRATGEELTGSPIEALNVRTPFDRYVFCDYAEECVDALRARVERHERGSRVDVVCGDAKSLEHLESVCTAFATRGLTVAYLDPARPQDLCWSSVKFLATRFDRLDLIINLPVHSLARAISGPYSRGFRGEGVAGAFLNHPSPHELMRWDVTRSYDMLATIEAIREYFDAQLGGLRFLKPARRTVDFAPGVPYYDVLLASRHPLGVELWDKVNPQKRPPPSLLDGPFI